MGRVDAVGVVKAVVKELGVPVDVGGARVGGEGRGGTVVEGVRGVVGRLVVRWGLVGVQGRARWVEMMEMETGGSVLKVWKEVGGGVLVAWDEVFELVGEYRVW